MYILANVNTKKVVEILDKKPISFSNNLLLIEVEKLPEKFDYLTVQNVREITDYFTAEEVEEFLEAGELKTKTKEVEKSRTYLTCDLIANYNKERVLTSEQKEKIRNDKIVKLIREKYTLDEEIAILRQKDTKPEKFNSYFEYANECVNKVPKQ